MKSKIYLLFIILSIISYTVSAQSYRVIVNQNNPVKTLTKKEVSDFFLKKKSKWSDGTAVNPVDLNSGSKVRDDFSLQIHGKSTAAVRNFWQQAAFSGTASAPPEKASDSEVIEYVKKNPGAIGYVSAVASFEDVKVITVN